ncbi:rhomboid family intramembrane serine protease [Albirhodobacter sp. R86504]|uniref:rhomboid family intramembrane serine protease n=1 Tax=Albirhodobacter sp. R86504 TaxID=3093848 RepID=UPI00366CD16A
MFPIRDHNPSLQTPYVTWALILVNVGMYLLTLPVGDSYGLLWASLALYPDAVTHGAYLHGLLTHMFLHAGLMHLGGNMLFLWVFGDNLEDQMGRGRFLGFYLLGGLAAAFAQILADPSSGVPMVGASGAIAGVMGGYLLLYPKARVDVLFFFLIFFKIFPIRAWIVLGVWFALQVFNGASTVGDDGGVAYWAHAGGFLAGFALAVPTWLRLGGVRFWAQNHGHPPHPEAEYSKSHVPIVRRQPRR